MPCNVVVSEREAGIITVAAMNPALMKEIVTSASISPMAAKATDKMHSVLEKI